MSRLGAAFRAGTGVLGGLLDRILPARLIQALVAARFRRRPADILEGIGPGLNRKPNLDNRPQDLEVFGDIGFEHLAVLYSSTSLDHAISSMTVRQGAYLFGLIRQMRARKVVEIGRFKGGTTLIMAAAMGNHGHLWSIDIGYKESYMNPGRSWDAMLSDALVAFGLSNVEILVGDSRTIEVDFGGEVDLATIDGDHSYEGVRSDFERFGRCVRVGGSILFDDFVGDGVFPSHEDTVGRLVREVADGGEYRLVKTVNRMAHLVRLR
jgi:predicted O-methyltransferase YrrM